MIDLFGPASPWARAALAVAFDVALKAAVLLVAAYAAHAALGRRRALARSALWNACLAGLLVLPAASAAIPRLRLEVLEPPAGETAPAPRTPLPVSFLVAEPPPAVTSPVASPDRLASAFEPPAPGPVAVAVAAVPRPGLPVSLAGCVIAAYLAVATLLAIRLAVSLNVVGRLRRASEPVDDPRWSASLDRWRAGVGIARGVALLRSERVSVPIVVGRFLPAIILPADLVGTASPGVIDAVLLHELSHVRRGDFGWNLVRKLVQLVYWPHPLAWPLGRAVGAVREQACDDLCVHALGGAATYRASLLEVAKGLVRRPEPALGLAMARRPHLGRRLDWIDRSRGASRCLVSRPARLALLATTLPLAGVLGSIELARSSARADDPPARAAQAPKADPASPPDAIVVVVVAKDGGKPLAGARVRTSIDLVSTVRRTGADGSVRIDLDGARFRDNLNLDVWADGHVQQRHFFAQHDARYPRIPARFTVELLPGEETLGGKVVDEEGRPIAGVQVEVWGHLGEKKEKHELAYMVDATTDDQGLWRCRCFRSMKFGFLYLEHPDYVGDASFTPRRHGSPDARLVPQPGDRPMDGLRDFSDVQVMSRGVAVAGTVADARGKPVAGAEVGWFEASHRDTFHKDLGTTTTDAEGRFRFPHARPGALVLQVKAKGHAPELTSIEAKDGGAPVAVTLKPPRTLAGRAVDSRGKPIPDVFVNIDTWRGSRALGVYLKTDAEGRFRWEDAPADPVVIGVQRAGYTGISDRRIAPEEGEATLVLKRSLAISGRVQDAATGKPIETAEVEVGVPDPGAGEFAWGERPQAFAFQGHLQGTIDVENTPEFRLRIKADGYEPMVSRIFRSDEMQVEYDVKLTKADRPRGTAVSGLVLRPDGRPLEGAEVALTYPIGGRGRLPAVHLENGKLSLSTQPGVASTTTKTDAGGLFFLTREPDPNGRYFALVVVHPDFYAEVPRVAFEAGTTITAMPWGRVEGTVFAGGKPAARASIRWFADRLGNRDVPYVSDSGRAVADDRGRFVLDRVVPGDVRVARDFGKGPEFKAWSNGTLVEVRPGETARADIGGNGRTVVARIVPPEGFDPKANYAAYSEFEIESDRPNIPYPKDMLSRRDDSMVTWGKRWWASAEGHEYRRRWYRLGQVKLQPDGTIRAADVPPGEYRLRLIHSADPVYGRATSPERTAYATKQFTIPEGGEAAPFDLGVLRPKPKQTLKVGQAVPPFDVEALGGGRLKLDDFRGKYVLLDFWATWCGPCLAELPELKELHDRFGEHERFAMLGLSLDAEKDAPRKLVAEKRLAWSQGFLGDWVEGGVQDAYHVEAIPAVFLIGPDGKLVASGLRGAAIGDAVAAALGNPP